MYCVIESGRKDVFVLCNRVRKEGRICILCNRVRKEGRICIVYESQ